MCKKLYQNYILKKRARYSKKLLSKLKDTNFTLITNNCSGGLIYNRLGLKFLSPTINLWFTDEDYLTFIYNLKEFVEQGELTEIEQTEYPYPVGKLTAPCGEIKIYFMHYKTYEQAKEKWYDRRERIVWDKLYFIYELKPTSTKEQVEKFNNFNQPNKLIYSMKIDAESPYLIKIDSKQNYFHGLSFNYKSKFSAKRWLDEINYVDFINKGLK